jgi:two-component system LytT family response regulator
MIKAITIDDEGHCLETLSLLLKEYCPEIELLAQCKSALKGLEAIRLHNPELVFLDVEMPMMNGFQMLEQFSEIPFAVIFTTSYDQYAIRAIRYSALDYLLKPIDPKELLLAIRKFTEHRQDSLTEQIKHLLAQVNGKGGQFNRIAVPTVEGFEMIPADQVIRCEANDNYTHLFLQNQKKIITSRTLKEMEEQLSCFPYFVRVHHSYIINLNEVIRYVRGEGGYLSMSDGSTVNVSRSRKEALLKWF